MFYAVYHMGSSSVVVGRTAAKHVARPRKRRCTDLASYPLVSETEGGATSDSSEEEMVTPKLPLFQLHVNSEGTVQFSVREVPNRFDLLKDRYVPPVAQRDPTRRTVATPRYISGATTIDKYVISAGDTQELMVMVDNLYKGRNISLQLGLSPLFEELFPEVEHIAHVFQSKHRMLFIKVSNNSDTDITVPADTPIGVVKPFQDPDMASFDLDCLYAHEPDDKLPCPDHSKELTSERNLGIGAHALFLLDAAWSHQRDQAEDAVLPEDTYVATEEELKQAMAPVDLSFEGMPSMAPGQASQADKPARRYEDGGMEDLIARGLDLSLARDTGAELVDGEAPALRPDDMKDLANAFLENYDVLSSTTKAPRPCLLKQAFVEIPTC